MTRWFSWACVPLALAAAGCATEAPPADPTGTTSSGQAGAGGQGGTGGAQVGGGGSGGSAGAGAGGSLPCGVDCSTIGVPDCLVAVCNEAMGACEIVPSPGGEACDDGLFCTSGDACSDGVCQGGAPNDCGMVPAPCNVIVCGEASDECSQQPVADGASCTAADLCTINATCQDGACLGVPKDCFFFPVPDACKVGQCNPDSGACEPVPGNQGAACSDSGDLCMVGKTCQNGLCAGGTPKNCSASGAPPCSAGACDPGSGLCYSQPINDTMPCDDGSMCTINEYCLGAQCVGGQQVLFPTYWLNEDFSDDSAGWTLGTDWEIGPAMESSGDTYGNADPGTDHTPTGDNGVAGVILGGNVPKTVIHGQYYLTSPVFDTSGAQGQVHLAYWRWLNSYYTTGMKNQVEVYNGSTWVVVWASGGSPGIQDAAWSRQSHDITAYKNANMRVRFGFEVNSTTVATVSGWNLDDVTVTDLICF